MLESSQGIHPLESYPSETFCVASATNDSASITGAKPSKKRTAPFSTGKAAITTGGVCGQCVAIATQLMKGFEVQGINPLATFKASLRDAAQLEACATILVV